MVKLVYRVKSEKFLSMIYFMLLGFVGLGAIITNVSCISAGDSSQFRVNDSTSFSEGKIVFVSSVIGQDSRNLYLMNGDGSAVRRLTSHNGHDSSPVWSPDGKLIAFLSDWEGERSIYLLDLATQEIARVNTQPSPGSHYHSIAWSPDSQLIAYSDGRNIFLTNLNTNVEIQVTDDQANFNFPHAWSPDGQFLLFSSDRDANHVAGSDYYTIDIQSGEITRITDLSIPSGKAAWSPNGEIVIAESGIRSRFSQINLISNETSLLIPTQLYAVTATLKFERYPDWLPDSQHIVFAWNGKNDGESINIYILDVNTVDYLQLTDDNLVNIEPAWWSPP